MIDKPGRYKISFEDYLQDPCPVPSLTRSTIKDLVNRSPAHAYYNHPRLNPSAVEESETKFDIGTAAHALFLEGEDVAVVIDADDWRTKAAKEARDAAREAGMIPLLAHQHESVMAMVNVAHESLNTSAVGTDVSVGEPEITYVWKEGETWLRIRPDWISRDFRTILDYKTTGVSANPEEFNRIAISTGLDIQQSLYRRGCRAIEGIDPDFIFMIQEVAPPYLCSFLTLDMMFQDMGDQKVEKGIELWRQCMESGKWPGYSPAVYTLEPPPWALAQWEMKRFYLGRDYDGIRI